MSPNYWKEKDSTGIVSRPVHHGDGNIDMRGFFDEISSLPVKFQLWELAPGVSEGAHTHEGENSLQELYYFVEGRGEMWFGDETLEVQAGEAVLVPEGIDHGMRNPSDAPLKLIIAWGKPDSHAAQALLKGRGRD